MRRSHNLSISELIHSRRACLRLFLYLLMLEDSLILPCVSEAQLSGTRRGSVAIEFGRFQQPAPCWVVSSLECCSLMSLTQIIQPFCKEGWKPACQELTFPWTCFSGYLSPTDFCKALCLSTSDSCFQPLEMYFSTPFPENSHDFHIHSFWFMPLVQALSESNPNLEV